MLKALCNVELRASSLPVANPQPGTFLLERVFLISLTSRALAQVSSALQLQVQYGIDFHSTVCVKHRSCETTGHTNLCLEKGSVSV